VGDGIEVPLGLSDFDVTGSSVVGGGVEVEIVSKRTPECCHCGSGSVFGHGRNLRRIRDRSVGRPTTLLWRQRRLKCARCGRRVNVTPRSLGVDR
jgi:transposase